MQRGLRLVVIDLEMLAEFQIDIGDRSQHLLFRQIAEQHVELALQRLRVDGPDHRHMQAAAGEIGLVEGAQIIRSDRGYALRGAVVGPRIGVTGV